MADNRQFGSPRAPHFGDKPAASDTGHCGPCEAMLADALDGALSPDEQALFDLHTAHCGPCAQLLADARRGAAWLEMLRDPRPEPPATLLERILAETSGTIASSTHALDLSNAGFQPVPVPVHGGMPGFATGDPVTQAKVLPFRIRATAAIRSGSFAQLMLQPRLAMTAAMAFLSIALTLDLTGVRLQDLRASDLKPSSLERDFYSANAHVVQYYDGLRVVYELESRVHDLQSATESDAASAPSASPSNPGQPASQPPAHGPGPQPKQEKPAPNSGTSRRNDIRRTQLAAEVRSNQQVERSTV